MFERLTAILISLKLMWYRFHLEIVQDNLEDLALKRSQLRRKIEKIEDELYYEEDIKDEILIDANTGD